VQRLVEKRSGCSDLSHIPVTLPKKRLQYSPYLSSSGQYRKGISDCADRADRAAKDSYWKERVISSKVDLIGVARRRRYLAT
jgi:hypothetical protein